MLNFTLLSLQTFPCCLSLFLHYVRKAAVQSAKGSGPTPWAACWTQATGLPDASLLTVLKPCTKKGYRIPDASLLTVLKPCTKKEYRIPDASLLTVLKPCTKKGYRILTCLLFISSLHEPQLCDPLDSLSGETQL